MAASEDLLVPGGNFLDFVFVPEIEYLHTKISHENSNPARSYRPYRKHSS